MIKGLVQTRNACDLYSKNLTTYSDADIDDSDKDDVNVLTEEDKPENAATVFSYSLYYVYYD